MNAPDVRRLLEDLGSIEPPPPDPDFIDRLEFQLRAEAIALAPDTSYDDAPWRVPFGIAAAAFTVVAGVAGITVIRDMPERHVSAQLAAATNVRVTLPNGEEYDAEPGMVIPKGAIVEVFSGGEAEINGMKFAAGSKVVVTDDGVRPVDGDDLLQFDDEQLAGPGRDSNGASGTRLDTSGSGGPSIVDAPTPALPTDDGSGPLRQAERAVKSRGFEAVRRTTGDTTPPQTSVADPAPPVDQEAPLTDQPAPPSTTTPETTAPEPAPAPPEAVPPPTEAPAPSTPPPTEAPAPSTPPTTEVPAPPTPPTTTPPTTAPEPAPPTTTTPDPSGSEAPPSGTTTTTTPDVDPAGEDGGEVTPPDGNGKGDEGGGLPTGDDAAAEAQPETSDDLASGDEETAAGADAGTDGSGSGTDETAAADTVAAE